MSTAARSHDIRRVAEAIDPLYRLSISLKVESHEGGEHVTIALSPKVAHDTTLLDTVEAAARGNRAAAEALLRQLLPRVRNLSRYLLKGDGEVEDAAQEGLVAVLAGLKSYRGEGPFLAWADRVVVRSTFALQKKRGPLTPVGDPSADSDEAEGIPWRTDTFTAETYLARRQLVQQLDELPFAQRSALVLHHVVGMSVSEIAAEIECSNETVRSRLRLGMATLRRRYSASELEPEGGADAVRR